MKLKRTLIWSIRICLLLVFGENAIAQDVSVLGRFSVANATGCAPLTVNVTEILPIGTSRQYWYENKDNAPELTLTHTYTTPGEYYLVQLTNDPAAPGGKEDSLRISVLDPTPPEFEVFNCANHTVVVTVSDRNYDRYLVDFDGQSSQTLTTEPFETNGYDFGVAGDYAITVTGLFDGALDNCGVDTQIITTIDDIVVPELVTAEVNNKSTNGSAFLTFSIGAGSSYTLQISENDAIGFTDLMEVTGTNSNILSLNTRDSYYCFRLRTFNACSNQFINSNILCTTSLDVNVGDGFNSVNWQTATSEVSLYRIIRDGEVEAQINDPSQTTYNDENILCGNDYNYEVQSFFNQASSLSFDTTVVAVKTGDLPALGQPSSNISGDIVELTWPDAPDEVPLSRYILQKSIGNRGFNNIEFTLNTDFQDLNSFFRPELSYQVIYEDRCGNRSIPSPLTKPIILNISDINSNVVDFEWNRYETWPNGIRNYTLERLDDNGGVIEEFSVLSGRTRSIEFSVLDDQPKNLRVRAESLDAVPIITYSNIRTVEIDPVLYYPKAFTPDDDGLNDNFVAKGPRVFNFQIQIFSRWGDTIYFSEDASEGWDGKISGNSAPEGSYIYVVNFEDAVGRAFEQKGTIILLRNK